jgi:DNA replication protein DnaC
VEGFVLAPELSLNGHTLADAVFDRLVYKAYVITLKGGSMRKRHARTSTPAGPAE